MIQNMRAFDKAKMINIKRLKMIKRVSFTVMIGSVITLAMLTAPYAELNTKTNDYVSSHKVELTESSVNEDIYAQNPYLYDSNVKAYIEAPSVFNQAYPVLQTDNNEYYLTHDIEGNYNSKGSIYKDARNNEGLSDDLTIIYGHNLVDNSSFGALAEYADKSIPIVGETHKGQDTYDSNKTIDYKDEYGHYTAEIFASGVYDASSISQSVGNFKTEEDFNLLINYIIENSDIDTNITPKYGDKIVCFWTCPDTEALDYYKRSEENKNNRVLVFATAKQLEKYSELPNTMENAKEI